MVEHVDRLPTRANAGSASAILAVEQALEVAPEDRRRLAVIGEFAVKYTLLAPGSYPKIFPTRSLHRLPSRSW